ncbi:ABC transporter ATP-binding protein [Thermococcus indicus]|uniref:ABC transporter ATP-binding protein n=1 Tax=Thermococcus indicus TaxID=2586643 RepID=A0A4Y5SIP0_9EURY|nr:ABC transporter ATP-binding protein [Thermococcus indicus]QDA30663.1 ABC transporter ATP-binding protein [Thermococcus indicus]
MIKDLAVNVLNLEKAYGRVWALKGISFSIGKGEIFGLIGPNGAGKSTTLKILATLIPPDRGRAEMMGHDVVRESEKVRRLISYLPEEAGAYKNLTGYEYLRFMARLYSNATGKDEGEMLELGVELAGLGTRLYDKVATYSKGMTRKLLLARALMVVPRLAILDEPTSGLDIVNAYEIRKRIKEFSREQGVSVLVSSHNMLEVEFLCDRVAIMHKGLIVETGTPEELKAKYGAENLEEVFVKASRRVTYG